VRKWRWVICLVVSILLASCSKRPGPTAEWITYRNEEYHFSFDYPEVWALSEGPQWTYMYGEGLASLNNLGQSPFWLTEQEMFPNEWEYGPGAFLKQLPSGAVYLEVGLSGGPPIDPQYYGPEMEASDLSSLMDGADWETLEGGLQRYNLRFDKWGRSEWNLVAYLREPLQEEDRSIVEHIFNTFRFDTIPVGDELWAIGEAKNHLPSTYHPERFPYTQSMIGEEGKEGIFRQTEAQRIEDDVLVAFTYGWGGWEKCHPDTCHQWLFRVTAKGEVILVSESGATPPEL